jgi:sigma-B regulation protein RsbU (phosphoserine phosphatase)
MINLRELKEFPNWALGLEFLRRSPVNFLLAPEPPTLPVEEAIEHQLVLWGAASDGRFFVVPCEFSRAQVQGICEAILKEHAALPSFAAVRSTNFMAFLNAFTQILNGKFELQEVAQAIADKTSELFDADGVSILLPNEDHTKFRFAVINAESEEIARRLDEIEVPADIGVTGWVARNRRSILVNSENRDRIFNPEVDRQTEFETHEILSTPILVGERLIGILQVVSGRPGVFKLSDIQIIELIAAIIGSFIEKAQLYGERLNFAKVQKELEIAHKLQISMMPNLPAYFGPFKLNGESRQVSRVGGDFWDIVTLTEDECLLCIGDVSGHGLGAALIMSAVRTASRALLPQIHSPFALIEPLNLLIHNEFGINGHYATVIFCHLELSKQRIHYFRAGHEFPIIKTADGIDRISKLGSLPIGLFPARQEDEWVDFQLNRGECVFFYTDGVLDGLPLEEPNLVEILREDPELEMALDDGHFFQRMQRTHQWQEVDDATMLKLSLV